MLSRAIAIVWVGAAAAGLAASSAPCGVGSAAACLRRPASRAVRVSPEGTATELASTSGAALASARRASTSSSASASADVVARGAALVRRAQCGRCHGVSGLGLPAAVREKSCSDCHAWIHGTKDDAEARAREAQTFPLWDQYVDHVRSYLAVPDLAAAGARLDPAWVSRFLREPYKIRPGFRETMIRTPFDAAEADAIAAYLRATATSRAPLRSAGGGAFTTTSAVALQASAVPPSARAEDVAAGERLYAKLMCARCHAFGARAAAPGIPAAPDLAHARARMRAEDIAAFIADPAAFGASTMPGYGISASDAGRLRDFLMAGAGRETGTRTATTTRTSTGDGGGAEVALVTTVGAMKRVGYRDVKAQVFDAICTHCHSDGKLTNGDGGPGNTGGLGYRGAGVDLSSWRGILRGARRADGRRVSLLEAGAGEREAPLLARLDLRVREHAAERAGGGASPGGSAGGPGPGMPLGQPPLDGARLALVRAWIAQGAPGPDGRPAIRKARTNRRQATGDSGSAEPRDPA